MTKSMLLRAEHLCVDTPGGRPLFRDLALRLGRADRVALVGRNGSGKTTLLEVLAGCTAPDRGAVVCRGRRWLVPQRIESSGQTSSPGELRRRHLQEALRAEPDLLLVDEPTQDLDANGIDWLVNRLSKWRGALLVVSHEPRLLRAFHAFFVVAESGCRHVSGGLDDLLADLAREAEESEKRYVRQLNRLLDKEKHGDAIGRRRERKKSLGRIHELRRCPSRFRLNAKRSYAQEKQGRRALLQEDRIARARAWAKAARRALSVELPLELSLPTLPHRSDSTIARLERVAARVDGRTLFEGVSLSLGRDRIAITGPNGSGKSTLVEILVGLRSPTLGSARCDASRIGYVAQDAANWCTRETLVEQLFARGDAPSPDAAARILKAHRFPFALAERPLSSLSPGERLRAVLICLFQRRPTPELLVLDEPGDSLDFLGATALQSVLCAWPGGLVVVSHACDLLRAIGIEHRLELRGTEAKLSSFQSSGRTEED